MENINVRGLPEPIARALQSIADALRRQTATPPGTADQPTKGDGTLRLGHRPGKVIGRLTREEIYDDAA